MLEAGPGRVPSGGPSGSHSPLGGVRRGQRVAASGVSRGGSSPDWCPQGPPLPVLRGLIAPFQEPLCAIRGPCDGRAAGPSLGHLTTTPGVLLGAGQGAHRPGLIGAGGPSRESELRKAWVLWGAGVDRWRRGPLSP